jgi:hypothetical protein
MKYSLCILAVLVSTCLFVVEAKKKLSDGSKKYEGDFEFAEEVSAQFKKSSSKQQRKTHIHNDNFKKHYFLGKHNF